MVLLYLKYTTIKLSGKGLLERCKNLVDGETNALPSLVDHAAVTRKWWIGIETIMISLIELRLCNILRFIDELFKI